MSLPDDVNFAAQIPGWAEFVLTRSTQKAPMAPPICDLLSAYASGKNVDIGRTTFQHIDKYLATGGTPARLEVACADFGYTLAELRDKRAAGKTGRDLAAEVVARPRAP